MLCSQLSTLTGFSCHPLSADGNIAMIDTSFVFEDGDDIILFVEKTGETVRFFDDGEVILHFAGRGIAFEDLRKTRFIKQAAQPHGVTLTETGVLEIWAHSDDAPQAFAKYLSALMDIVSWEKDQIGVGTDISMLVSEVAMHLRALKPQADLTTNPEYRGISGATYKLDFNFDGEAVIAVTPNHNAVSSAIKKLVDIRSAPSNHGLSVIVVLEDRYDPQTAGRERLILDAVGKVWPMTMLAGQSRMPQH